MQSNEVAERRSNIRVEKIGRIPRRHKPTEKYGEKCGLTESKEAQKVQTNKKS